MRYILYFDIEGDELREGMFFEDMRSALDHCIDDFKKPDVAVIYYRDAKLIYRMEDCTNRFERALRAEAPSLYDYDEAYDARRAS